MDNYSDKKQNKPPCKPSKIRNEKGRCVKIKDTKQCPPSKIRNEKGKCVNIKKKQRNLIRT